MHTHSYQVEGFGKVVVNVNGDWSGEAIIRWNFHPDESSMKFTEAVLPAKLLLELSKQGAIGIVRDQVISALESL
jgi:hypothetical protein